MRAVVYTRAGDPEVIQIREVPPPEPGPGQIRVRIYAAGLNRADLSQRRGNYPVPPGWPQNIPGLEYAGEIESLGPGVTRWKTGDRVMGLAGGGAQAELIVVHEDEAMPMPTGMSFREAAAVPEAFLTAYDALKVRGRLGTGERVLIHAVASGVGTAATQVAQLLGAATVLGTSRTQSKLERARPFGLDVPIHTMDGAFAPLIDSPVHVILDVLGGPALQQNLEILAPRGRLVVLGLLQGSKFDGDFAPVLRKRLEIIGTLMRPRLLPERIELIRLFREEFFHFLEEGRARPVVGDVFPMEAVAEAHEAMERNETFGKLVLEWT